MTFPNYLKAILGLGVELRRALCVASTSLLWYSAVSAVARVRAFRRWHGHCWLREAPRIVASPAERVGNLPV